MVAAQECEAGNARRRLDMHGIEGYAAALDIKADGIDGAIGAEERCGDSSFIMDISFRSSGPRIWSGSRSNPLGVARCGPHLESVVEQMSDDPAPEKTGAAENRDQSAMARYAVNTINFRHDQPPTCPPTRFEHSPQRRCGCFSACSGVSPCQQAL
jgi:hypothetical protein